LDRLTETAKIENAPIGSNEMLDFISDSENIDIFCIHHAVVGDYKSEQFSVAEAVEVGTFEIKKVARLLCEKGLTSVVITRSIFESSLGIRSEERPVNRYAIAKRAVSEIWENEFTSLGIKVKNFVIANPIGALEEKRLTNYLVSEWKAGKTPVLKSPLMVRDNLPIDILATSYRDFVLNGRADSPDIVIPSYYRMTNIDFASRVAKEFGERSNSHFKVESAVDPLYEEPMSLIGESVLEFKPGKEKEFWTKYFNYYFNEKVKT
jgi:hypothetical protein